MVYECGSCSCWWVEALIVVTVARKPCTESTVASNALAYGCGAVNIDGTRIAPIAGEYVSPGSWSDPSKRSGEVGSDLGITRKNVTAFQQAQAESVERTNRLGRWPANLLLQHDAGCTPERCVEDCPVSQMDKVSGVTTAGAGGNKGASGFAGGYQSGEYTIPYGDTGGASRYFKQFGKP